MITAEEQQRLKEIRKEGFNERLKLSEEYNTLMSDKKNLLTKFAGMEIQNIEELFQEIENAFLARYKTLAKEASAKDEMLIEIVKSPERLDNKTKSYDYINSLKEKYALFIISLKKENKKAFSNLSLEFAINFTDYLAFEEKEKKNKPKRSLWKIMVFAVLFFIVFMLTFFIAAFVLSFVILLLSHIGIFAWLFSLFTDSGIEWVLIWSSFLSHLVLSVVFNAMEKFTKSDISTLSAGVNVAAFILLIYQITLIIFYIVNMPSFEFVSILPNIALLINSITLIVKKGVPVGY